MPPRNRARLLLIGVLALSLLGNAVALGAALRFQALRSDLLGPAAEAALFPRATRQALRADLADHAGTLRPALHALTATRARMVARAAAQPFDRAAVAAEMTLLRQQADALLAQVQSLVLDSLAAQSGG